MLKLFIASMKMLYRNRQALFWATAAPIIIAVIFGLYDFDFGGSSGRYYDFLLPGLVAMGVMSVSIGATATAIAGYKDRRIFKRILVTPLAPAKFIGAQVAARLVLAIVQVGLLLGVGMILFGASVSGNLVWVFVLAVIGNAIFLNIGFIIAGRSSSAETADMATTLTTLPMVFLSGVFFRYRWPSQGVRYRSGLLATDPAHKCHARDHAGWVFDHRAGTGASGSGRLGRCLIPAGEPQLSIHRKLNEGVAPTWI